MYHSTEAEIPEQDFAVQHTSATNIGPNSKAKFAFKKQTTMVNVKTKEAED